MTDLDYLIDAIDCNLSYAVYCQLARQDGFNVLPRTTYDEYGMACAKY